LERRKYILSFIIGLITSFYIIVQPISQHADFSDQKKQEQKQNDSEEEKVNILTQAFTSGNSQINLEFHSFLIEIVEETEEQITVFSHEVSQVLTGAIKLILSEIKSPNAP